MKLKDGFFPHITCPNCKKKSVSVISGFGRMGYNVAWTTTVAMLVSAISDVFPK